jgi:hypothetical protein
MDTDLFASRLATRLRLPIAAVGVASLLLAIANLFLHVVGDQLIVVAATVVGVAAAGMFLSAVFDMRFQRAVSALNAERRAEARENGSLSRLTGWGLPVGDRLLVTVSLPLLVMALVAANYFHRPPATALLVAAFALVGLAQMALMVRGQPTDRWFDPFS